MGRVIQPKGTKGSLKWIQYIVNNFPKVLNNPINDFLGSNIDQSIEWLSPKQMMIIQSIAIKPFLIS